MVFRTQKIIASLALAGVVAGCASTPPNVQSISSTANPTTEIEKTEMMLNDARSKQVDVLSPENFTDASKALQKAKEKKEKNKSNEDILEQVSYSRAWLEQANAKAEIAKMSVGSDITDAREGAMKAGAPKFFPKEWDKNGKELEKITHAAEKGNLKPSDKRGEDIVKRYRELERMSVSQAYLGTAKDNLDVAKKDGADKNAPKSYSMALMKYENAEKMIMADPRNTNAIARASQDATRESQHLMDVTRKVNAGNSEDLVLMAERQQRQISNLRSEYSSTEQELQQVQTEAERRRMELEKQQALLNRAQVLRSQLKPNEAEVFTENGKLMVRLKGLQFPSAQSTLGPKNQALLNKVESALPGVTPSKIIIEGHTDSTGNPAANQLLSEKRAQAVENYLVSRGTISVDKVEAIGRGDAEPVSDNSTQHGRAQNRRIDLVIETE
ncbi:OmpA family protein [Bdellovibrio bacteriovorus]|uniref:OmpA family protein n=1 Tax=Bdellovibrio bacteriovorus TaxID=959 RepID=UPI0035A62FBF